MSHALLSEIFRVRGAQWSAKGRQAILDVLLLFLLAKETILGVNKPKNTIKNISKALEPIFLTKNQKS